MSNGLLERRYIADGCVDINLRILSNGKDLLTTADISA